MKDAAIVWLRRDLRLHDNPALFHASRHQQVVVVYIHAPDEEQPWSPGAACSWWLHHSLEKLSKQFKRYDQELNIFSGNSLTILRELSRQTGAKAIYWNRLYEPAVIQRDKHIKTALQEDGITAHSFNGSLLREPWEVTKDDGETYRVFTPFSKKHLLLGDIPPPVDAPTQFSAIKQPLPTQSISSLELLPRIAWDKAFYHCWQPGTEAAHEQLEEFIESVDAYGHDRDIPGVDGVSKLSPYLHFGELSPRQVWHRIKGHGHSNHSEEKVMAFLRQLIWRDYAHHLLFHFPETTHAPFNRKFEWFPWEQNHQLLTAWQQGRTGIPLVDAGMRQLWSTGWMHNRVRMVVASFLTKNGLVHWQEGAQWFWGTLVDANLANNTMGWQWTAGCGVDAAPYFRVFNPIRQGIRFDPLGEYVKHWVPELQKLSSKFIHQPDIAPALILKEAGVVIGDNYPKPVVDLASSRNEALLRYKQLRQG